MEFLDWFFNQTWYGIITFSVLLIVLIAVYFMVKNKKED